MRTVTIERTYYTVRELQLHKGSGFDNAVTEFASDEVGYEDWSDEWASLKALDDAVGFGRDHHRHYRGGLDEVGDLTGKRAWAWLENVVLAPLRLPWGYMSAPGPLGQDRRKNARYKQRPGTVPPCPFTGYYTDEVLLDHLREAFVAGMSVADAMLGAAATIEKVIEDEWEYRTSEEAFIERAENEVWEFLVTGQRV